jgi:hypothetical protein
MSCFDYLGTASWSSGSPNPGAACDTPGQICNYTTTVGDNPPAYSALECSPEKTWEAHDLCPQTLPMAGSPCDYAFLSCYYDICPEEPGDETLAYCNAPTWTLDTSCPGQ